MKISKFVIAIAGLLAFGLLTACSTPGAAPASTTVLHASYATGYSTLDQLTSASDVVVEGTFIASRPAATQDGIPYTDSTFRVSNWVKGLSITTRTITIHQTGGTMDGKSFIMEDDPPFTKGEHAVLYLKRVGPDMYFTLGGPTGRLEVTNGQVNKLSGTSLEEKVPTSVSGLLSETAKFVAK